MLPNLDLGARSTQLLGVRVRIRRIRVMAELMGKDSWWEVASDECENPMSGWEIGLETYDLLPWLAEKNQCSESQIYEAGLEWLRTRADAFAEHLIAELVNDPTVLGREFSASLGGGRVTVPNA
jgi:hypothetical protein